jgi:cullin-4
MFTDMDISKDVMNAYSLHVRESTMMNEEGDSTMMEFSVQVLSSGYWPTPTNTDVVIPSVLSHQLSKFKTFYNDKYQGRRLAWSHNLDKCIVVARFPKGKKELEVTLYQALVLQCFNLDSNGGGEVDNKGLSIKDVQVATNIELEELRRTLVSLACAEVASRVLIKEPKGREVLDTDVFRFNTEFTSKLFRIKIKTIVLKETEAEVDQTNEEVFRDRQYAVDANIVRIMKARKQLTHPVLIGEILSQLKFPVTNTDIKRRIESLIEREYLERDKSDLNIYRYLA